MKRWLKVGVEAYVLEGAGPAAFPEAALDINRQDDSVEVGLRAFAETLSANGREALKLAVADCLEDMEPRGDRVPVVKLLLGIAVELSAEAVLPVLAQRIGRGFFGDRAADPDGRLFNFTLYAVANLARSREAATSCLRQLIASPLFFARPALAGTALLALCRAEPEGLLDHMDLLREALTRMFKQMSDPQPAQRRYAEQIIDTIGPDALIPALDGLDGLDPQSSGINPDDWLLNALLFMPPPILEHDGDTFRVRAYPQIVISASSTCATAQWRASRRRNNQAEARIRAHRDAISAEPSRELRKQKEQSLEDFARLFGTSEARSPLVGDQHG
ncbi:MAG: hypothetical protein ACPGU7_04425 [Gammaproteobacteria bacterium]